MIRTIRNLLWIGLLIPNTLWAHEFTHFKVRFDKLVSPDPVKAPVMGKVLKSQSLIPGLPEGSSSPLMNEIAGYLSQNFSAISAERKQYLFERNKKFNLGVKNYSGFNWQKPVGSYGVYADRQLFPDPSSGEWIVSDYLIFNVNAQTYLQGLNNSGLIEINQGTLGAYAGLEFQRMYVHKYKVKSFEEGMSGNYHKLFLSFMAFMDPTLRIPEEGSYYKREDHLAFRAAGMLSVPLQYNLMVSAGFLFEKNRVSTAEIYVLPPKYETLDQEKIKLTFETTDSTRVGFEASLKADFFQLLKLTLLSFEYSYTKSLSEKVEMSLKQSDLEVLRESKAKQKQMMAALNMNKINFEDMKEFITAREKEKSERKTKKFTLFNYGNEYTEATNELFRYIEGQNQKHVFSFDGESISYKRGLKNYLQGGLFQSILGVDLFKEFKYSTTKNVHFDFEHKGDFDDNDLVFKREMMVAKTTGKSRKSKKKELVNFVKSETELDSKIADLIAKEEIRGPIKVISTLKTDGHALTSVLSLSNDEASKAFAEICDEVGSKGRGPASRSKYSRGRFANSCQSTLYSKFVKVKKYYGNKEKQLWSFKDLMTAVNLKAKNFRKLYQIFGLENVYYTGVLEGYTKNGESYRAYFENGKTTAPNLRDNIKSVDSLSIDLWK